MSFRINVIGASGSGASTLGGGVAAALSLPCFDSDDYYHGPSDPPFQNPRSASERFTMITADLLPTKDWVLSGGVAGWVPYPELDFTLIAFLTVPTDERIRRLRRREQDRFQERVRAGGDMHAAHEEFIHWASRYDIGDVMGKTRERHEAYLAEQSCPVLRLDGLLPASQLVERVVEAARQRP